MASFRFAHVSDLHVGASSHDIAERLIADVNASGAQATVVTGDLTMRAHRAQFDEAMAIINRLPAPELTVLGNHDVPLFNPYRRLLTPYSKYEVHVRPDLNPILETPAVCIVGLNSMPRWRWKSGHVSENQIEVASRVLARQKPNVLRVLAMHHPPSLRGLETIQGSKLLHAAIRTAGVDYVLAGHTHVPAISTINLGSYDATEVICGTSMSTRIRHSERSWMLFDVTDSEVTITERREIKEVWATAKVTRLARRATG